MELEINNVHEKNGQEAPLISREVYDIIRKNESRIHAAIVNDRDFGYDYFGFKTLERSYLVKVGERTVETPQYLLMRVSIGIHLEDIESAIGTYDLMSRRIFTHATPTLFNAGTCYPQMSSCEFEVFSIGLWIDAFGRFPADDEGG